MKKAARNISLAAFSLSDISPKIPSRSLYPSLSNKICSILLNGSAAPHRS